jgi:hypothetical protein
MNSKLGLGIATTIATFFLSIGQVMAVEPVINACVDNNGGIRLLQTNQYGFPPNPCQSYETPISWGVTGPRGPSDGFLKDQRSSFGSQALSGTPLAIIKLTLPSGRYVVNATAAVVGGVTFATAQCFLRGSISGNVSDAVQTTTGGSGNSFAAIPLTTAFTLTATEDIALVCSASGSVSTQPSTITAIRVETLTKQ